MNDLPAGQPRVVPLPAVPRSFYLSGMAKQRPYHLSELVGQAPNIRVTCLKCGRARLFDGRELLAYFRARAWSMLLDHACQRFVCGTYRGRTIRTRVEGCGARCARITATNDPLVPAPPTPPTPGMSEREWRAETRRRRR